ncbi:hypothetical protein I204_05228 [Kwoniella mangroviensis CBS 8886]|uniref:uncharacterized protein n=1 Tax=Kwoniella mangroviensis CBS 8507 TaxID=1296122 RepID=UPI00080D6D39|nr:uncharacterized protein I203_04581 [Kwoniella mangroviensis CBS 8507]OCF66254.1 hypothetical protein I203_04581 [Kwoniella mangroviensis CBS 8507]OCF73391.1 hypothetical protein I204_05228 [Kwoniella mangroviensis CBS 8886]
MSVDLSDPQIGLTRSKIQDPSDPTTWFLLHYVTSPTSPTSIPSLSQSITVLSSGPEPLLPSWQEHLTDTNEDVLFGYGEIAGKGLVLLFLRDSVGGVKRARAVVHSRSIASLFPDYTALITIAHPSQLTEELITERLALNQPSSLPSTVPKPKYTVPGSDHPNPLSPLAPGGPMPFLPSGGIAGSSRSVSASATPYNENNHIHHPSPKKYGDLTSPVRQAHNNSPSNRRVISLNDPPATSSSPGPPLNAPISLGSPVKVDVASTQRGISSADYFGKEDGTGAGSNPGSPRSRKTSFGVRLKNTFSSNSNNHRSTSSNYEETPSSPPPSHHHQQQNGNGVSSTAKDSPKESRFKNSSLVKAFHRRRSSTQSHTPPDSPNMNPNSNADDQTIEYAPPVPPKDKPLTPPTTTVEPPNPLQSEIPTPTSGVTLGHGQTLPLPAENHSDNSKKLLSPSPSAKQILYDARQKSLEAENEIQQRFRRDQEDRLNGNGNGLVRDKEDDEESVRLAYDQSEDEDDRPQSVSQTLEGEIDKQNIPTKVGQAEKISQAAEEHAQRQALIRAEEEKARLLTLEAEQAAAEEKERLEKERVEVERKAEEDRRIEEERIRLERIRLEEEARKEEEERVRLEAEAEAERVRVVAEEERLRAEAEERARIEAEERARVEAEQAAERARLEAEEKARLEAEELARKQAEEAEIARIKQLEEEELARKRAEERAKLEKEEVERRKLEEEQEKKRGIQEGLEKGKREGGVMLRGWVTVQTYKSMTWRRRYFHLLPKEMQLYKAEGDAKPIQTIYIGPSSSVSEKYEESQVKDSFKVISNGSKGEEEFFLFTDSGEDKEIVLEGLRLCMI